MDKEIEISSALSVGAEDWEAMDVLWLYDKTGGEAMIDRSELPKLIEVLQQFRDNTIPITSKQGIGG